jgi:hypothetical protein
MILLEGERKSDKVNIIHTNGRHTLGFMTAEHWLLTRNHVYVISHYLCANNTEGQLIGSAPHHRIAYIHGSILAGHKILIDWSLLMKIAAAARRAVTWCTQHLVSSLAAQHVHESLCW